jgi:hypothetical protein
VSQNSHTSHWTNTATKGRLFEFEPWIFPQEVPAGTLYPGLPRLCGCSFPRNWRETLAAGRSSWRLFHPSFFLPVLKSFPRKLPRIELATCCETLTVIAVAMHYEDYRYIRPEERSSGRHLWTPLSYLQPPTVLEGWHIIPQSILQHSPNGLALKAPRFLAPIMVPT